jgi:hypothetical protein
MRCGDISLNRDAIMRVLDLKAEGNEVAFESLELAYETIELSAP